MMTLPCVHGWSASSPVAARQCFHWGDHAVQVVVDRLVREAESTLEQRPVSVMDKSWVPPSGDKHDVDRA